MSLSLTLCALWALAATVVAFLPMRWQYIPGFGLLVLSVPLLVFVALQHGTLPVVLVLAGMASMFRRPLIYFYRRARGLPATRPRDEERAQ